MTAIRGWTVEELWERFLPHDPDRLWYKFSNSDAVISRGDAEEYSRFITRLGRKKSAVVSMETGEIMEEME